MKKFRIKSFLVFISCLLLSFSLIANSASISENVSSQENVVTIEECYKAGTKWIAANYDESTQISTIIPVKNLNEKLDGYCICFENNDAPCGYILINADKSSKTLIKEFCLDGKNIYQQLVENSDMSVNFDPVLYTTTPFNYAVKYTYENEDKIYTSDNVITSLSKAKEKYAIPAELNNSTKVLNVDSPVENKEELWDMFFNSGDLINYTSENNCVIPNANAIDFLTMEQLRTGTNTGNCAPTALTNLCFYYYRSGITNILLNQSISDTYDALVNNVEFDINGEDGTYTDNILSGLTEYAKDRGCTILTNHVLLGLWAQFKLGFNAGVPCLLSIDGYELENNEWNVVGHSLIGIGYRVLTDETRYIRVIDGWSSSSNRFLNYDSDSLLDITGDFVKIYE